MRYAANLGFTMAFARLLAPGDFGLFGMAFTFTGLLLLFKDGGVESAMLSHGPMVESELAALGSLNALFGLTLALGCAALGPLLARLYGEPRLAWALLLPAGAFLFHGLDVVPGALLLRAGKFRLHAAIELLALLAGLGTTLALALNRAGHWALFATEPVMAAVLLIGHSIAAGRVPQFSGAWQHVRHFIQFGGKVSLIRALGHTASNVDNLLLGLAAGPVALAFYAKAFRLINLPHEAINWPLTRLAVPALAGLRDQPAEFVRAYRHFNLTSMALGLPCVAFLIVSTREIVALVYGPQWGEVVPLIRLLGAMGLANTFLMAATWVYLALGTVRRQIGWEIFNVAALTAAFAVGLRWQAAGVAAAASIIYTALRVPALLYCFRGTPVRLGDIGAVLWRPLLAAGVAAGAVLLVRPHWPIANSLFTVLARDGLLFTAAYALGWLLVPGWRQFLRRELRRPAAG